jgi:2-polyprenyl-3-methyl-5-hydroxy-6-metoxy-1,4-benzoquinol methylase
VKSLLRWALQADEEHPRLEKTLLHLLKNLSPERLLDVGCGDGRLTAEIATSLKIPADGVHGIEAHPPSLQKALAHAAVAAVDIESDGWPYPDAAFDLVVVNQVLEHLKNPHICLAEAERVLKTGGFLAVGVPNLAGLMNRLQLLAGGQPMAAEFPGPHVRGFAHGTMLRFLRSNSAFTVERALGSSLYPLPWPLVAIQSFPSLSAYAFTLLKKKEHHARSSWRDAFAGIGATTYAR